MDRRDNQRRARRIQVQFWKRGEPHHYSGYSTNFSPTGMFVSTSTPLGRGERVRLEVLDAQHGFFIEGVVMHAARAATFQQVKQSGMGVRFLRVEDLIAELMLPTSSGVRPVVEAPPQAGVYAVRFGGVREFLDAVQRDILTGGLFVPTDFPAPLNASITVEIHPPGNGQTPDAPGASPGAPKALQAPILAAALVVQRFEPRVATGTDGAPLARLPGMGVVFTDPQSTMLRLQPAIGRLTAT